MRRALCRIRQVKRSRAGLGTREGWRIQQVAGQLPAVEAAPVEESWDLAAAVVAYPWSRVCQIATCSEADGRQFVRLWGYLNATGDPDVRAMGAPTICC